MAKEQSRANPFGLRIPDELKAKLLNAAAAKHVSLNREMVMRLEASFQGPLSSVPDEDLVAELLKRYPRGAIYIRIGVRPPDDQ